MLRALLAHELETPGAVVGAMPQVASRAAMGAGIGLSLAPRVQPSLGPMGSTDQAPNGSSAMLRPAVIKVLIDET
eukprot:9497925-Pyramimonas_sp.AAC.2